MSISHKSHLLNLDEIARSQTLGPIAIGSPLSEVGPLLHDPKYWGFGIDEKLSFYVGFGGVEVHFRSEADMPRVFYAEISVSGFKNNIMPFLDNCEFGKLHIKNTLPQGGNEFESAKVFFTERQVPFTTGMMESVTEETAAALNFGRIHFYYRNHDCPQLDLISLS
ncbi:MAG: hypothetical protein KDK75_14645 [Alphaproteobacteria bacterium]|nr:hypothetical protein [Alphaproteobacteria bacterium]